MDLPTKSLAGRGNVVLQVNRSHLERTEQFFGGGYTLPRGCDGVTAGGNAVPATVKVVATKKSTASKSCSLVFLRASDARSFVEDAIDRNKFLLQGLNKIYVMTGERFTIRGSFGSITAAVVPSEDPDSDCPSRRLLRILQNFQARQSKDDAQSEMGQNRSPSVRVKVDVFPMKLQRRVVTNLSNLMDAHSVPESELDVSPDDPTHVLSVVEINPETYLVGIAPAELCAPAIRRDSASNDICRAYRKLSEAFERYRRRESSGGKFPFCRPTSNLDRPRPAIAVDCGAAPGGWTKYLVERVACDRVYAIDPGEMDRSLASSPAVRHLKMTAARAIPKLRDILAEQEGALSLWVSDMCLHDMPRQVDIFLRAHGEGLFRPDAAFVLTIKCNKGHGRKRFDAFAVEQAGRLKASGAYGVEIMHLFSNRLGERTIVGFVK